MNSDDDWQQVTDARVNALTAMLGTLDEMEYHASHPFYLGGQADVLAFHHHLNGIAFVTSDLTGLPEESECEYELMICTRENNEWAPSWISNLAPYTLSSDISAGDSMDISRATPPDSKIKAFVFDTSATFTMFDREFELLLCLGITKKELEYKKAHGSAALLKLLKKHGVYPFTDLDRGSVPITT